MPLPFLIAGAIIGGGYVVSKLITKRKTHAGNSDGGANDTGDNACAESTRENDGGDAKPTPPPIPPKRDGQGRFVK